MSLGCIILLTVIQPETVVPLNIPRVLLAAIRVEAVADS